LTALIVPPHFLIQFYFSIVMIFLFEMTLLSALLFQNYRQHFHTL
jgi:hypothetical protein